MKQNRLVVALSSLDKPELTSLKRYLLMETSKGTDLFKLMSLLTQALYPKNKVISTDLSQIKSQAFSKMSEKSFLNLCSRLFLIFEDWLIWYDMKAEKNKKKTLLIKYYNRRGLFTLADKTFKELTTQLEKEKQLSLEKNDILKDAYYYAYFSENPIKSRYGKEFYAQLATLHFHSYQEKTRLLIAEMQNWGSFNIFDYSLELKLLYSSLSKYTVSETGKHLDKIVALTKSKSIDAFEQLTDALLSNKIYPGSDLEVFTTLYSTAYSMRLWSGGKLKNKNIILDLQRFGFDSGVLERLGKITPKRFLNIVSVLVLTSNLEEVADFVNEKIQLIDSSDRYVTQQLSLCYIKREENKPKEILSLLREIKLSEVELGLLTQEFIIKAMYMDSELDLALYQIQNYKRRLRTKKDSMDTPRYLAHLNFSNIMKQMVEIHLKKREIDLNAYQYLHHKIWIQKQLDSLVTKK